MSALSVDTDKLRLFFTYLIALVLIGGGMFILYMTMNQPPSSNTLAVVGLMTLAANWVFTKDQQSSVARQIERATVAGAASSTGSVHE